MRLHSLRSCLVATARPGVRLASTLAHVKGPTGDGVAPLLEHHIFEQLARTADVQGDEVFATFALQGIQRTWGEFADDATRLAEGLLSLGYRPGDKVGIWLPNFYEWLLLQFACHRLGCVVVNVNPAYKAHELEYALNFVGCKGILLANSYQKAQFRSIIASLQPLKERLPHLEHIFTIKGDFEGVASDGLDAIPLDAVPAFGGDLSVADRALFQEIYRGISPTDAANIQYTSGSTGNPKPAALTHRNILNNGYFVGFGCDYRAGRDKICIPVPLYHCFGTVLGVMAALTHQIPVCFPSPTFDEKAALETVEENKCTALYGVPTMFIKMLTEAAESEEEGKRYKLSSLRTGIIAGSTTPPQVMADVSSKLNMNEVTICYGMTETSPVSFQSPRTCDDILKCETVGLVLPHCEAKVIRDDGSIANRGEIGEFCSKGYIVMQGYYGMEEETRNSIDEDGFMHSGDLATIDAAGFCRIVGRKKDMIIRGGENIYPSEVEALLHTHPDVEDVAVTALPHAVMGEQVAAFIIPKAAGQGDLSLSAVRVWCQERISHFKVPTIVHIVDAFPLTATGKVQKFMLQQQYS
eukprot:TRINITY_DN28337_c0_g1_i2.p1 TRINITY_DN28337_c0_g1~~TRINITY_DN28337_c0_g1_i2.p1  ORF type:complete len:595 (+),score=230.46 TRINITY_DN28337_c0_g1_i2:41-1786(+)